jgi:hypothetical protein
MTARSKKKAERAKIKVDDIMRRVDRLPILDSHTADEILGYDEGGLPQPSNLKPESEPATALPPAKWPDFAARRKKIFGNRVLTTVDDLIKDRGRY